LKQITVISGKGGTGKTTLTASFAALAGNVVVADCDVDAPNLHMLLKPEIVSTQEFRGGKKATINETKCTKCGECEKKCRFSAIKALKVDRVLCEGCGVCAYVCPAGAVDLREEVSGYAYVSKTAYGFMSHARLSPGEENSGKLVSVVRQNARNIAEENDVEIVLNDGPPGIGCPVIASLSSVDVGVVVVEPTLSGIHDMERALKLLDHFQVYPAVCINKYDINADNTRKIVAYCRDNGISVAGKISYDPLVLKAMVSGKPVPEYSPRSRVSREIEEVWSKVVESIEN
jgi:MinD superfamily P-loop ATPase